VRDPFPSPEPPTVNYFLTYCMVTGALCLVVHHGKVIVPGNPKGALRGFLGLLGRVIFRGWILAFVLFYGARNAGFAEGYGDWWYTYTATHSMLLWVVTTLPLTIGLWLVWHATLSARKDPAGLGWWGPDGAPCLHRISMALPACWGLVFYSWLLLSPTLPFYSCFLRHWVMGVPMEVVLE
jgi:hypothetical protein